MTKKYYLFGILIWKVETEKPKELEVSPEVADYLRSLSFYTGLYSRRIYSVAGHPGIEKISKK